MDLARLAQRQCRIRTWEEILSENTLPKDIHSTASRLVSAYRALLIQCWESTTPNALQEAQMATLDRELDGMHELVRLQPRSNLPIQKDNYLRGLS